MPNTNVIVTKDLTVWCYRENVNLNRSIKLETMDYFRSQTQFCAKSSIAPKLGYSVEERNDLLHLEFL
jgi:hypothetical protein